MKRDFDLIRGILIDLEEWKEPVALQSGNLSYEGKTKEEILYHCKLLIDSGFIEGKVAGPANRPAMAALLSITMKGHDFLDDARNETVWTKSKAEVATIGSTVSLEIMKMILVTQMKSLLGLH